MKIWVGILTIAIILLSIGYGNLYCSTMQFDGNNSGVLISALGVIVTLLIGWQIYNAIELNKKVSENAERLNNSFRAQSIILEALDKKHRNIIEEWIEDNFSAIPYALKGYDPSITSAIIDNIIEAIEEDKKCTHPSYRITSEQKQNFIKVLDGISLKKVNYLRKLIKELPE